ncbi:MAG TPA: DEAD/DEAH box helicase [Streptosporangiaceae bacterium]|nr:DEAD/DEAH box helicase [Streptosporangiaceae bacterium]
MSSALSASNGPAAASQAFDLLTEPVRRWVYDQRWLTLRDAQEVAIPVLLAGEEDVIIAAATASGKTEAAFLPICSRLGSDPASVAGARVLYIAPLKALINDQYDRLSGLCESLEIPVHRWHGDVPESKKLAFLKRPDGILLITPESLEALFVRRGPAVASLLTPLQYVVVDELHAFLGTERGAQLRSLLHRVELAIRRRVPRVGLSATLGDMSLAAGALRPAQPENVRCIVSGTGGQELSMQVRGYLTMPPAGGPSDGEALDQQRIAEDLFRVLRGNTNLAFANSRTDVELYAARLRDMCEAAGLPNEFFPHHGNLSKELREDVEAALKSHERPATAVATTTLEMGIDIGSVHSVAQLGAPPSVAALRQRLGRAGRRGEPAILRVYVTEQSADQRTSLPDELRAELVQTIAMLELMLAGWCEPPAEGALHLSTLIQQLLSAIAQHGGITAASGYRMLCGPGSPFTAVTAAQFGSLLRGLGAREVLVQAADGILLLGPLGERTVNHYSFYAAFTASEEYRLFTGGRPLGTMPADFTVYAGVLLIFAGRRWKVTAIDHDRKIIEVVSAPGGRPPRFRGDIAGVHDRVRAEMRSVLAADHVYRYLSATAVELLSEARAAYARYRLAYRSILQAGPNTLLLPWAGSKSVTTLTAQLSAMGLDASNDGLVIHVARAAADHVREHLQLLAAASPADALALAATVANKASAKYDGWIDDDLLAVDYARRSLDTNGAWRAAKALLASAP